MSNTQDRILLWLAGQKLEAYVVGGSVRDALLRRPSHDLDLAVASNGRLVARRIANQFNGAYYSLDASRDTGRALLPQEDGTTLVVDVACLRGGSLVEDLGDRDFTINAMAVRVSDPDLVIDLHHGREHLAEGILVPVSSNSIHNDPIRALRAVRMVSQFNLSLATDTVAQIEAESLRLRAESGERLRDELAKLFVLERSASSLAEMDRLGLLMPIFPELGPLCGLEQSLPHRLHVLDHSLQAVQELESILSRLAANKDPDAQHCPPPCRSQAHTSAEMVLSGHTTRMITAMEQPSGGNRTRKTVVKLAALLHDVGKAQTQSLEADGRRRFLGHEGLGAEIIGTIMRRLRFNNSEVAQAQMIVRHHLRPLLLSREPAITQRAIYRFFRSTGAAGPEILLLSMADYLAKDQEGLPRAGYDRLCTLVAQMLEYYWPTKEWADKLAPLINGHDLMERLDLEPGPRVGKVLEAIREAQVLGEITSVQAALSFAETYLANGPNT